MMFNNVLSYFPTLGQPRRAYRPRCFMSHWIIASALLIMTHMTTAYASDNTALHWQFAHDPHILSAPLPDYDGTYRIPFRQSGLHLRRFGPDTQYGLVKLMNELQMPLLLNKTASTAQQPIAGLALAWAFDSQQHRVIFKLDSRARWSDQKPVSSVDFSFSFTKLDSNLYPWLKAIRDQDDLVVFELTQDVWQGGEPASIIWQQLMSFRPLPAHVHGDSDEPLDNGRFEPTTGPYYVHQWQQDRRLLLRRTDSWWASERNFFRYRFAFETIELAFVHDNQIALTRLRHGEFDALLVSSPSHINKASIAALQAERNVHQLSFQGIQPDVHSAIFTPTNQLPDLLRGMATTQPGDRLQRSEKKTYRLGYYLPMTSELAAFIARMQQQGIELLPLAHTEDRLISWSQNPNTMQLDWVWLASNHPTLLSHHPSLTLTRWPNHQEQSVLYWPWVERPNPLPVSINATTFHPWNLNDGGLLWLNAAERSRLLTHSEQNETTRLYTIEVVDPATIKHTQRQQH